MSEKNKYTNEQLLEGMKDNNSVILGYIYHYYFPQVEAIIIYEFRGNSDDAKDVFQDALMVVYNGIYSTPPLVIEYSFLTFLTTICKRKMIGKIRKKAKTTHYLDEDDILQPSDTDIIEMINKADRYKLYQKHFNEIGKLCRTLLKLVMEGLSNLEITERMNLSSESYTKKRKTICKDSLFTKIYYDPQLKELINGKPWTIREIPRW
jgi:RNA polymerase sigma factor (sigma-70 family)